MKKLLLMVILLLGCAPTAKRYNITDLQGAWWSDLSAPTADFAIHGEEIWLDHDSNYHPVVIEEGNFLVYNPGTGMDPVRRKILDLRENKLILESVFHGEVRQITYSRQ